MIATEKKSPILQIGAIMKKQYINESAWNKIFTFLKNHKNVYIIDEIKCKSFIESIFWMARTGAQWRELPTMYGNWNSIFKRFNAWSKKHLWSKLLQFCAQDNDLESIMIDATIIRAHACSAGYNKQHDEGLGRCKGGFTTKIHAKVDALGNLLKVIITAGHRNDIIQAEKLLEDTRDAHVIADKGYISKAFREKILQQGCIPVIPSRNNSKLFIDYDKHIYRERHLIECFFGKLKHFRRVFSRFDKSLRKFSSFVSFVGAILWLR